jgi:membrane dipeptidase
VRVLQLTPHDRNAVGDAFREKTDAGLSRLGEEVVAAMSELGMLIDLSHCSRLTTLQAVQLSAKPCAITHAGCRALHPTARNKTDEEIRAVARKGGFFGVFNMSVWLTQKSTTSIDDVLDHIDHAVKVAGVDHVGFGSDGPVLQSGATPEQTLAGFRGYYERNKGLPGAETYPYHVNVPELNHPRRLERLAHALARRRYKDADIEKIIGGNIARVLTEVLG